METKNVLLAGIGGQGTILASKLLTEGLINEGYDVKMSEVHGMSQREGSVLTHVRYGDHVYSPVVEELKGDVLIGFEQLEVLRNLNYLKEDGLVVTSKQKVAPIGVLTGELEYPNNIEELIEDKVGELVVIDAMEEARKIGNTKVMNVILLGTIVKSMELEDIDWEQIIKDNVKEKFVDLNIKALKRGMSLVS